MIALVQVTFPDLATAERAAEAAVAARLAACANLLPCRSVYRWDGAAQRGDEVVAQFKTLPARAPALVERLAADHPYDLPAIEWWQAEANPAVIAWISDAVT